MYRNCLDYLRLKNLCYNRKLPQSLIIDILQCKKNSMDYCLSSDGSYTLYSDSYQEHYHSLQYGALNEALHKHIYPAFNYYAILHGSTSRVIKILDICFGLGYNVLSTLYHTKNCQDVLLEITSVELDSQLISSLQNFPYPTIFRPYQQTITKLSQSLSVQTDNYSITIVVQDVRDAIARLAQEQQQFDIIYQDPFSYKRTPELWSYNYFTSLTSIMHSRSILTTYSKATRVRLGMHQNGFWLYDNIYNNYNIGTIATLCKVDGYNAIDLDKKLANSSIHTPI